ncbi:hypothetical protein BH23GEM7_BH23GEM7_23940 [soil metagenome]|nr:phage baseplate protein [Gemmatimonadota bacterium]
MRSLSAAELLEVWERGQLATPVNRALLLLAAAEPETPPEALAALAVGRRNARLLRLRECTFGPGLKSVTTCPTCGEWLELALEVSELLQAFAPVSEDTTADGPVWLDAEDGRVRFRLPTSLDLAAVAGAGEAAPAALLERCVEEVADAEPALPPEVAAAVAERMAEADPLADPELALTCPACGDRWSAPLDVVAYFWTEIEAWARRTLHEVHLLASAYGWSEGTILALSPQRRQAYLELVST